MAEVLPCFFFFFDDDTVGCEGSELVFLAVVQPLDFGKELVVKHMVDYAAVLQVSDLPVGTAHLTEVLLDCVDVSH